MPTNKNDISVSTTFIWVFAAAFGVQNILYFCIPDVVLANTVYHDFIVVPVVGAINFIFPHHQAYGLANSIHSGKVDLEILRGCDGAGMLFLLEAAIIAFPASAREKVAGLAMAVLLVYVLNCVRLVALFYVASFRPWMFESVHVFYIPSLFVALGGIYFLIWSMRPSNATH